MTHIVPERIVGVPAQAVTVTQLANVKFEIKGTGVTFYETPEAFNNRDTFETFDLARAGAIQAFAQHKADVLSAIAQTEKELLTLQGPNSAALIPLATNAPISGNVAPAVVANSPAVQVNPVP